MTRLQAELQKAQDLHILYGIFDILLLSGIILAAAITAATVLISASPWAQMGASLGFSALYTLVGQPLANLLVRRNSTLERKDVHPFVITIFETIRNPINLAIVASIAIACGLPFWGGFATMSAAYVNIIVCALEGAYYI